MPNSKLQFDYECHPTDDVGTPAKVEITNVYWDGNDITDFVLEHCCELIHKWEENIHRSLKD